VRYVCLLGDLIGFPGICGYSA